MLQRPAKRWDRRAPSQSRGLYLLCWFLGTILVAFLVVPLIALALSQSGQSLASVARMGDVRDAIALSLEGAFLSAAIAALMGVPLAYGLARTTFPGKSVVAALVDLPLAVPHTVAGIALLMVLGRQGVLGAPLQALVGLKFWGTLAGIVAAMLFVSAPYTVNAARIGFRGRRSALGENRTHTWSRPVANLCTHHAAAGTTQHHDRRDADLRPLDQRIRRGRHSRLLPDDGAGQNLRVVPSLRSRPGSRCVGAFAGRIACLIPNLAHALARYAAAREPMSTDVALQALTLTLGAFRLQSLNLTVSRGQILVILGPNGSGKSVTLEIIAGFHRPDSGRVLIGGRDVTALAPEQRNVGYVVQNFGLFPHLTVAQNIAIARRTDRKIIETGKALSVPRDDKGLLAYFDVAHLAHRWPEDLSPGEKQRVALARVLASEPDLFLFDEPFTALDTQTRDQLRGDLLSFLRTLSIPAIFVTHDHADAMMLADQIAVLREGAVVQDGPAADIFGRPVSSFRGGLSRCRKHP